MIYIILPAYNEEASIPILLEKIHHTLSGARLDYKVIAVNDGSVDKTAEILKELSSKYPLEVITHKINRGLGETARDGFERAAEICKSDDIIVRLDCDDTHEPKYIIDLVNKINEGYDVVITSRFQKGGGMEGVTAYRGFISRCANLLLKVLLPIKGVKEYSCGFRAYRGEIIQDAIAIYGNSFVEMKGLGFTCTVEKLIKLRNMKARMAEVPFVLRYDQKKGYSKMLTSITTLGYFVLILKNIYPWGNIAKGWKKQIEELNKRKRQ